MTIKSDIMRDVYYWGQMFSRIALGFIIFVSFAFNLMYLTSGTPEPVPDKIDPGVYINTFDAKNIRVVDNTTLEADIILPFNYTVRKEIKCPNSKMTADKLEDLAQTAQSIHVFIVNGDTVNSVVFQTSKGLVRWGK